MGKENIFKTGIVHDQMLNDYVKNGYDSELIVLFRLRPGAHRGAFQYAITYWDSEGKKEGSSCNKQDSDITIPSNIAQKESKFRQELSKWEQYKDDLEKNEPAVDIYWKEAAQPETDIIRIILEKGMLEHFYLDIWFQRNYSFSKISSKKELPLPCIFRYRDFADWLSQVLALFPKTDLLFNKYRGLSHACYLKHDIEIEYIDNRKNILALRDKIKILPYLAGILFGTLPVIVEINNGKAKIREEIVVGDNSNVRKILEDANRAWYDDSTRAVLVRGQPGTGKENIARSIHFNKGRLGGYFPLAATADLSDTERKLYGQEAEGHVIPGFIEQSEGGTIFLDEIDKSQQGEMLRNGLLRLLESREYYPCGSKQRFQFKDVLFVFTASKPIAQLRSEPPPDFWTRMTHDIEVLHPLKSRGLSTEQEVNLQLLLGYFWAQKILSSVKIESISDVTQEVLLDDERPFFDDFKVVACQCLIFEENWEAKLKGFAGFWENGGGLYSQIWGETMSRILSEVGKYICIRVGGPNKLEQISIRSLRIIAYRVASFIWDRFMDGKLDEIIKEIKNSHYENNNGFFSGMKSIVDEVLSITGVTPN